MLRQPAAQRLIGPVEVLIGPPVLHRGAKGPGLDGHVRPILGHHHLGLHIGAFTAEIRVVVEHLDGPRLGQAPRRRLPAQLLKQRMILAYADGFPDGKDLLLRVLQQDDMICVFHDLDSFQPENVQFQLAQQLPLFLQLPPDHQPPLPQPCQQLPVLHGQQRADLMEGKPVTCQPLNPD